MPNDHSHNENNHAERTRRSSRSGQSEHKRSGPVGSEMAAVADAIRSQIGEFRSKSVKAGLQMQTEMLGAFEEIGRDWVACAASQTELALRLPNRLTAARTIPDAISAYQDWLGEWFELRGETNRRLILDGQKIVDPGTRYMASIAPGASI
jgi:hypothetical protein